MLKSCMIETILTSGISATIVAAIVGYIFKIRMEEKLGALKAQIEKAVFFSKLQYEHEYKIYRELWAALIDLRRATLRLRPTLDTGDSGDEQERNRRLEEFGKNAEEFRDIWEKNRPFYAASVYDKLDELFQKCYEESIEFRHIEPTPGNSEYWEKARENRGEILTLIEDVCAAIRERLTQIAVLSE